MPTQPGHDLARTPAAAEDGAQGADRRGVEVVVRPVRAFLDTDRSLDPRAVGFRLGHHLGRQVNLLRVDPGNLRRHLDLRFFLRKQPFFPVLEAFHLELAPGSPPLPGGVPGTLAKTGVRLPIVGDVVADKFGILPAVLDDHPLYSHVHHGIRPRQDVQVQAAVFLGIGYASGSPRVHHDDLGLVTVDTFENPVIPQCGLGLERVSARNQHTVGQGEILV